MFDINKDSIKIESSTYDYLDIIHDKFQEQIIKILKPSSGVAKENKFSINEYIKIGQIFRFQKSNY